MILSGSLKPLLLFAVLLGLAAPAAADTIVIDDTTPGTIYDSVMDGAFVPPPPAIGTAPADGTPDSQGQPLSIAFVSGGIEQRGIAEFPLASLAGLGSEDIAQATLTFNIDDVLGQFWPHSGATFDNTAAQSIAVFSYEGDGTIQLTDFNNVVGAPAGVFDTFTPYGTITDASLSIGGALVFTVDITARLQALIDDGATHAGVVFATNDTPTGTSLDGLGVSGAQNPFITVTTVVYDPPIFDTAPRACQAMIALQSRKYASFVHVQLQNCFNRIVRDNSLARDLAPGITACANALDPQVSTSKVAKKRAVAFAKIVDKCTGVMPVEINSPCNAAAVTVNDIADCVLDGHFGGAQELVRREYADACGIATGAAIQADYPILCTAP